MDMEIFTLPALARALKGLGAKTSWVSTLDTIERCPNSKHSLRSMTYPDAPEIREIESQIFLEVESPCAPMLYVVS